MAVHRLSISMPAEIEQIIRSAAEAADVPISTWIVEAALKQAGHQAAIADGLKAVEEYEIENGPIPAELLDEADRVLDAAGLGVPEREERRAS